MHVDPQWRPLQPQFAACSLAVWYVWASTKQCRWSYDRHIMHIEDRHWHHSEAESRHPCFTTFGANAPMSHMVRMVASEVKRSYVNFMNGGGCGVCFLLIETAATVLHNIRIWPRRLLRDTLYYALLTETAATPNERAEATRPRARQRSRHSLEGQLSRKEWFSVFCWFFTRVGLNYILYYTYVCINYTTRVDSL